MPVTAGVAIVGALTGVASAVANIKIEKDRLQMQKNLSFLDAKQRNDLEKALQKTNDKNKQLEILYSAVANIKSAQSTASITSSAQAQTQRDKTTALIVIGGAIALLIGIIVYKKI
jgi:hypothetical protein